MRYIWIGMILCFLSVSLAVGCIKAEDQSDDEKNDEALQPAEHFVYRHLMSDQGLIKTGFSDQPVYLSESLGLWMEFLISKKDGEHFHEQYQHLNESFLMNNNLVSWQIQNGQASGVNALIDDLRIMVSLDQAAALWGNSEYKQTARNIGAALRKYNMNNGILTDFYDSASQSAAKDITLSYIMPDALSILKKNGVINKEFESRNASILYRAPLKNGFLPKAYSTETKAYTYDHEVNLIDQLYAAWHLPPKDQKAAVLADWLKQTFQTGGKLYGRYSLDTKKPAVQYESPSVYALAILFFINQNEDKTVIKALYDRMNDFEILDSSETYYGGYMSGNDTHSFDNLLPLLAERKLLNENLIQ
ncbi:lipoprotein YdaJ [Bacillus licheniformis]|uniref:lipoprotein YdaJ n=1 Tax=Bacillus licheniformis TaxID=1402 RepID=UPI001E420957|nr:lipoprotein YdaJ [Bacillus licheniformis]MCY9238375.1 lipoprotein YdaJ [Bacillus licheniformis]MED1524643.1 lipoprotein YdaJ [Bacillus licheniformis]MED4932031.1 lipoprotein YdaJ [Bacillus licheniformis]